MGASGTGATASSGVTSTGTTTSTNTTSGANNNLASTAPGNCAMGKKAGAGAASTAAVGASTGTTGSSTVTTTTTLTGTTGSSLAKAGNLTVTMLVKDLLKFNIKDTAGKTVGKIQDAVINTSPSFMGGAGIAASSTVTTTTSVTGTTGSTGMAGSANMMGSSQNGGILYLVVELDRSLSNGSKWVFIPLQAFSMGTEKNTFNLVVSSQVLSGAPAFDKNALPDGSISGWDTMIQSYWNQNVH